MRKPTAPLLLHIILDLMALFVDSSMCCYISPHADAVTFFSISPKEKHMLRGSDYPMAHPSNNGCSTCSPCSVKKHKTVLLPGVVSYCLYRCCTDRKKIPFAGPPVNQLQRRKQGTAMPHFRFTPGDLGRPGLSRARSPYIRQDSWQSPR